MKHPGRHQPTKSCARKLLSKIFMPFISRYFFFILDAGALFVVVVSLAPFRPILPLCGKELEIRKSPTYIQGSLSHTYQSAILGGPRIRSSVPALWALICAPLPLLVFIKCIMVNHYRAVSTGCSCGYVELA